ncbi:PREDICTED: MATH and LRR domain-containing protein PFE0570w [Drosophila arizonae]|uniref:MATH and LRR domain-containing protein PFE0570w n=1 Tax=Drosophila arizonae TaxID=7263 RepID=A0ABM1PS95_DROAR|nr:PREDICTED: MATH and LRR domain-containing protein PFE0570w [Drosophila arizonae]
MDSPKERDDKKRIKQLTLENGVVKDEKKVVRQFYRQCKSEFLEENDYEALDPNKLSNECHEEIQNFNLATHDAWIVQCPKGININSLAGKRIKLPGRRYAGDIQVRSTHYERPLTHSIGYVNSKGKYAVRSMPMAGHVVISKRLNMQEPDALDNGETNAFPKTVGPQKFRLPVRHPFFGRDYKTRVDVDKKTAKKLRNAEKMCAEATKKLRSTGNFYRIRQKLLASTQTLKQKEHDVRQSVITGVAPKFLEKSDHPDYVDLLDSSDGDTTVKQENEEKQPVKKKKSNKSKVEHNFEDNDTEKPNENKNLEDNSQDSNAEKLSKLENNSEDNNAVKSNKKKKLESNSEDNNAVKSNKKKKLENNLEDNNAEKPTKKKKVELNSDDSTPERPSKKKSLDSFEIQKSVEVY